jgi:hypothetical protein
MAHVVTAPLVSIKDPAGSPQYFYQGSIVPEGFDKGDIERLTEAGLVEPEKADEDKPEEGKRPAVRASK